MTTNCDALVIGGGPAGAVTAGLLARAGWSVVVLECKSFPRRKVCGEYLSATNWPLLCELGVADEVAELAGPDVRRVGLFVGDRMLTAELPLSEECGGRWGRALSRERLDTILLERAKTLGADVRQPCQAKSLSQVHGGFVCQAASTETHEDLEIFAPTVIAAHGSWEVGTLPTQSPRQTPQAGDLFGFKAHFRNARLDEGLMPLLCFPGGYGGMVHADDGYVSLSCCIRRDRLEQIQRREKHSDGEAVYAYVKATTPAVGRVLENSVIGGRWLSAGPIRPGIRTPYGAGIFRTGNAAGEAHPAVAEGITMAMQSAWLLSNQLAPQRTAVRKPEIRESVGRNYAESWKKAFSRRVRFSKLIAGWAMRPYWVQGCLPVIRQFPDLLTWGARLSGKINFAHVGEHPRSALLRERVER